MKRIYVNGKYLLSKVTGVQRVAIELVHALSRELAGRQDVSMEVLEPPRWLAGSRHSAVLALLWEQFVLPWRSREGLLLSLCNTGPVIAGNQVLVMHDAAVFDMPENYHPRYVAAHKLMMYLHRVFRKRLFTVSQFSRHRLAYWLGIPPAEIGILGLGAEHVCSGDRDPGIVARLGLRAGGYVLAVGSRQPGKNFKLLIDLARNVDLGIPIVVVGKANPTVFKTGKCLSENKLLDAGYITDPELIALFSSARCYVQPSLYEGFGLPVLEAMALGVPVLSSNAGSLPEIGGDAVRYFDPHSVDSLADALHTFLADAEAPRTMGALGRKRARAFSWPDSASRFLQELSVR